MSILFAERRLISSFRSRSVVFVRKAMVNEKKAFLTQCTLEFGNNGYFGLRTIVNLLPLMNARDKATVEAETASINDKFIAHFKTINEFIRLFDETIAWLRKPAKHRFNIASTVGFNPLFIHSGRTDKEVRIEVFGRYSSDLNLGFEASTKEQLTEGICRLLDLRECLVAYRDGFKKIDLNELITL